MQKQAMEVIEAARNLGVRIAPQSRRGFTVDGSPADFTRRLIQLAEAIEQFDKSGAAEFADSRSSIMMDNTNLGSPDDLGLAHLNAGMPQRDGDADDAGTPVDDLALRPELSRGQNKARRKEGPELDSGSVLSIRLADAEAYLRKVSGLAQSIKLDTSRALDLSPGTRAELTRQASLIIGSVDHALDGLSRARGPDINLPAPADDHKLFDIDVEFLGNDEIDLDLAIDAMMDKLEFAVRKVGWSPKLRALAVAWKNAQNRAAREHSLEDGPVMRIPVADWVAVSKVVTEVALDQKVPQPLAPPTPRPPAPKPENEREFEAPKLAPRHL